ncbi:MAG TPA: hypothetical protein VNE39_01135 [Planctomycetota bacterium]|nr:hypothetical protein [Planctomycetota bacterium]
MKSHAAAVLVVLCLRLAQAGSVVSYVGDIDQWQVEVFAGSANPGGILEGPALEAGFDHHGSLCFLPSGEAYFATGGVVFHISKEGTFRFLAGLPGMYGCQDGPVTRATLGLQSSICLDGKGGLYIGDRSNRCIRRLLQKDGGWIVETVAGDPSKPEWKDKPVDGTGREAVFKYLHSNVVADAQGTAFIMDDNFLRRITPDGKVETLNPQGGSGKPDDAPLESARFSLIMGGGMCFGPEGALYVADRWNHCIRKVDLAARQVTIAVGPGTGYRDGPEKNCGFHDSPGHIVYDPYRKRFNTNGVDDWGLRAWQNGEMRTIAGGVPNSKALEGPARESRIGWCGTFALDPRPPHEIYFWSGHGWTGRIGRLYRPAERKGDNR